MKTDSLTINTTPENAAVLTTFDVYELKLYQESRNALLEIFPLTNGNYEHDTLILAENFAIKLVLGIKEYIETKNNNN